MCIESFQDYLKNQVDKKLMFKNFLDDPSIVWLSTDLVYKMSAKEPTYMSSEEYKELWKSIQKGMKTPIIITVSKKNYMMRNDSGNHRIRLFKEFNVSPIPCKIEYVDNQIKRIENGTHKGIPLEPFYK